LMGAHEPRDHLVTTTFRPKSRRYHASGMSMVRPAGGRLEVEDVSLQVASYLRLVDSCITQLKAQGPSMTCNESKEEEEVSLQVASSSLLLSSLDMGGL